MEDEVEVVPNEDNGNVPLETVEQPVVESVEQPTEPVVETYELPDGRKVDGETLAKEWKENFYPEYTRKSQALAELEKNKTINQPTEKPYQKPDWQPQNWGEAIQLAKQEALEEIEGKEKAKVEQQQAVENAVVAQLTEIKKVDPTLNENALFLHANKYGFKDLQLAHQNMKDMSDIAKKVADTTAKNIAKRNDPVSVTQGATGIKSDPSQFAHAKDFLRSLK